MHMPTLLTAVGVLAGTSLAQSVTIEVQGPSTAQPGEVVSVAVRATLAGFPGGAIGGYGLDLDVTAGRSLLSGVSPATSPALTVGVLPGAASTAGIERAVGGQLPNVSGINPGVDTSSTITLFTADVTIDPGAASGDVTLTPAFAESGGFVVFPDASSGANLRAPGDAGVAVTLLPLTIGVGGAVNDCVADIDGDGDVDLGDFGLFGSAFNARLGDPNYNPDADLDGDGDVDLGDFGIFGTEFNRNDCL